MKKRITEAPIIDLKQKLNGFVNLVRRGVSLILCVVIILGLSSCWSRRELNTLAIVLATAVDVGEKPDEVKVTAQIVKPGEIKSAASAGGGSAQKAYVNIQNTDESVLTALRGITHLNNRSMYFSHNRVLIFSREAAEKNIAEGLDTFTRNFETRLNVYILISKGKASEVLDEAFGLEKIPANHIAELVENQRLNSETMIVTLRDFDIALLSDSLAPVAPLIELYEDEGEKKARLEGTAIFKQGRMVGELDLDQTRGLMWATGKAQEGIITLDTKWGDVDLQFIHINGSMKPMKTEDGTIRIKLSINANGCVTNNETQEDMSTLQNIEMLKKQAKEYILADIESTLKEAKALSADVFGFGEAIRRDYPKEWEKMKNNWDEGFRVLEPDIEIDVKIHCTGNIGKPLVPGGGE